MQRFAKAAEQYPNDRVVRNQTGRVLFLQRRYEEAIAEFQHVISIDAEDPYALQTVGYGVANWHLVEGDRARAREILEEIAHHRVWPGFGRIAAEVELTRFADEGASE